MPLNTKLTCKDCPYWDTEPLHEMPRPAGYCRINHPSAISESDHPFPLTFDSDWCYAIRPELEEQLKRITERAAVAGR